VQVLEEGTSDWKGRREQIVALRDQVKALKAAQVHFWVGQGGCCGGVAVALAHAAVKL
jgi:hypothetical protein